MTAARDRLAIAELTTTLSGEFDLPTVLDTIAHDACRGFMAASAVVILLDTREPQAHNDIQVVAEALHAPTDVDLSFVADGPASVAAHEGAVTMIADLDDADDTRWPGYRRDARRAGIRGMRAFPVTVLGAPLGALVVHTEDPWGVRRPNEFGQVLANLIAIAISMAPHAGQRRADTSDTIGSLLHGTVTIATATGILAELSGAEPASARLHLHRLARAHNNTVTAHAEAIVAAHNHAPDRLRSSGLLSAPGELPPPPHIGTSGS